MMTPGRAPEFEALARRHRPALQRQALRLADGDADRAEDMVQDALATAWRRYETFMAGTSFIAWVGRIMYHGHVSRWRRPAGRMARLTLAQSDLELVGVLREDWGGEARRADTTAGTLDGLLGEEVAAAAGALAQEYWEATVLFAVCGLSYQEIGARLGVPVGTVRSRLFRGRHRLRVALSEWAREELGIVA